MRWPSDQTARIYVDDKVTWRAGTDTLTHSITSSDSPPLFDVQLSPGDSFTYTFTIPGAYYFYDLFSDAFHLVLVSPRTSTTATVPKTPSFLGIVSETWPPEKDLLVITVGSQVSWSNAEIISHTLISSDRPFNSGSLNQNQAFAISFPVVGTFSVVDSTEPNIIYQTVQVVPALTRRQSLEEISSISSSSHAPSPLLGAIVLIAIVITMIAVAQFSRRRLRTVITFDE